MKNILTALTLSILLSSCVTMIGKISHNRTQKKIASGEIDTTMYHNLKIFNRNKEYHYHAWYMDSNGDTLSNEIIVVQPSGKIWKGQASQTAVKYIYNYSPSDSAKLAPHPVHENEFTRKYNTIIWKREIEEGIIENDKEIWMHPFRNNQYALTEIAPFPTLRFSVLSTPNVEHYGGTMFLAKGWGKFAGKKKTYFTISEPKTKQLPLATLENCREINSKAIHSNVGTSTFNYWYHEDYGFVEMNYEFYNGQKIRFVLEAVKTR